MLVRPSEGRPKLQVASQTAMEGSVLDASFENQVCEISLPNKLALTIPTINIPDWALYADPLQLARKKIKGLVQVTTKENWSIFIALGPLYTNAVSEQPYLDLPRRAADRLLEVLERKSSFNNDTIQRRVLQGRIVGIWRAQVRNLRGKSGYVCRASTAIEPYSGRGVVVPDDTLPLDGVRPPTRMLLHLIRNEHFRALYELPSSPREALEKLHGQLALVGRQPTHLRSNLIALRVFTNKQMHRSHVIAVNPAVISLYAGDFDGDCQLNTVVVSLPETQVELYCKQQGHPWNSITFWRNREMTARMTDLPYVKGSKYYIVDLAEIPHKDPVIGRNDHTDFHEAEDYISVIAYNEQKAKLELAPVSGWSIHKDREIWTVTLHSGRQIITDDDPRAVYGLLPKSLTFARRRPSESLGMMVPVARRSVTLNSIPTYLGVYGGERRLASEIDLGSDFGYLLGATIGDGWCTTVKTKKYGETGRTVCLAGINASVMRKWKACITKVLPDAHFGAIRLKHSYGRSVRTTVASSELVNLLLPLIGKGAKNKHLPPFWFSAPEEFKWGLISGLIDTDGCISRSFSNGRKKQIAHIASISLRLLRETQHLLMSLGIRSRITYVKQTVADNAFWHLCFSIPDLQGKRDKLVLAHEGKKKVLYQLDANPNATSAVRTDLVPITSEVADAIASQLPTSYRAIAYRARNSARLGRISRAKALEAAELCSGLPEKWLWIIRNTDVSWEYVTSIENTHKVETGYDLTVPGYETFMSVDGIILSNTLSFIFPSTRAGKEDLPLFTLTRTVEQVDFSPKKELKGIEWQARGGEQLPVDEEEEAEVNATTRIVQQALAKSVGQSLNYHDLLGEPGGTGFYQDTSTEKMEQMIRFAEGISPDEAWEQRNLGMMAHRMMKDFTAMGGGLSSSLIQLAIQAFGSDPKRMQRILLHLGRLKHIIAQASLSSKNGEFDPSKYDRLYALLHSPGDEDKLWMIYRAFRRVGVDPPAAKAALEVVMAFPRVPINELVRTHTPLFYLTRRAVPIDGTEITNRSVEMLTGMVWKRYKPDIEIPYPEEQKTV